MREGRHVGGGADCAVPHVADYGDGTDVNVPERTAGIRGRQGKAKVDGGTDRVERK